MPKHIVRLILLMAVFAVVLYAAKVYFTAPSFYQYGHYRADSVAEVAAQDPVFQTARYCRSCHTERHAQWSANSHKTVNCETCHGAAQGHPQKKDKSPIPPQTGWTDPALQEQPQKGKLSIPRDAVKLCTLCHEAMPGRPRTQPQIEVAQHNPYASSGQQCTACHNPHAPKMTAVVVKVAADAAAGAKKHAASCIACHGAKGISPNDTWPNLAGQNAAYLARILAAYKSGDQKDVAMTPLAQALSDADIQNLAAYYSGLSCDGTAREPRGGDATAGKALAKNCAACHGETGVTGNPAWPHLAGQKPGYLANVLKAFRAGLRKDPMMAGVTRALSDTDIANLAAYYSGQSCKPPMQGKTKP